MQSTRSHEIDNSSARVSEIQIVPVRPKDGVVGFASFVLNDSLYLGSIAIMTRPGGGYRLLYPTKRVIDSSISIFHPISRTFAGVIQDAVIGKFEGVMNEVHDEDFEPFK